MSLSLSVVLEGKTAIKRRGAVAVMKDLNKTNCPDMPLAFLNYEGVEHTESLAEMGELLSG